MFRTILIDDEKQARVILKDELKKFDDILVIDEASNVPEAISKVKEHSPDIIFLDIHLGLGNGFDVLNQINQDSLQIIFVTAYDKYAIQSFKYNTLNYILKPIHYKDIQETIKKLRLTNEKLSQVQQKINLIRSSKIAIPTSEGISFHAITDIIRCQSDSNYTFIYFTNHQKLLTAKTLKEFEELLSIQGFERVHNSHLINLDQIQKYSNKDGGYLIMTDGSIVPIAQRKKSSFLKLFSAD